MPKKQVWSEDGSRKQCPKCGEMKPPESFRPRKLKSGGFGFQSWCLPCAAADSLEKMNRKYREDPAWRERKLARDRENGMRKRTEHRAANPRVLLTPEERLERQRASYRKSAARPEARERARVRTTNYRALKKLGAAGEKLTKEDRLAIFEAQGWRCKYCTLQTRHLELDHVVPLTRGGAHTRENVVGACRGCNTSKNNRTLAEWTTPTEPQWELSVYRGRRAWKLTDEQVAEIRERRAEGESRITLAADYNVCEQYITDLTGKKRKRPFAT